jgi:hypothetical protein
VYPLAADNYLISQNRYNALLTPPRKGVFAMIPHLFYYQLAILGLLWLCVMLHLTWPSRAAVFPQKPVEPELIKPKRQQVAYLLRADNVSRPLPFRLHCVNEPVISTPNVLSTPPPSLLACL